MSTFLNPVLPGFHPDPSVCKGINGGYLLVTSSFEYFPGVPIFYSDDLVDWTPLGHVLDRAEQLDLTDVDSSDGIWAATIREHDGTYYVITTLVRGRTGGSNFIVTATDPTGPWSTPFPLQAEGIDPSLFFDDDGRCWFTACRDNASEGNPGELWMQEFDVSSMALIGPQYSLWSGALAGAWVEGPHIYRKDDTYYLLGAEGGTERNHAVTMASSATVTGPYLGLGRNPVLTHRHLGSAFPIQNVGHADLIETDAGETWAVVLGVRPRAGSHVLGREVFLVPVTWEEGGPIFAPGVGHIRNEEQRPLAAPIAPSPPVYPRRTHYGNWTSALWSTLRYPRQDCGVTVDGEILVLTLLPGSLAAVTPTGALLRRQQDHQFEARVTLNFEPLNRGDEAGLAVVQNRWAYSTASLRATTSGGVALVTHLHTRDRDTTEYTPVESGPIELAVRSDGSMYEFSYRAVGTAQFTPLPFLTDVSHLSTERAGGFTGVQVGPYATGNGRVSEGIAASFTEFTYEPGTVAAVSRSKEVAY